MNPVHGVRWWMPRALCVAVLVILIGGCVPVPLPPTPVPTAIPQGPYMMMNPPPDSDKPFPVSSADLSCWLHTAANMLAGAGYGAGTTVQARADDIWADMSAQYGANGGTGGWPQMALQWWLASANNTWTNNPYSVVTVYGGLACMPWANTNGARDLGNALRGANPTGLCIRWPTAGSACNLGHAITTWGDDNTSLAALTANPGGLRVTDSDTDTGGDVQAYTYDAFTSPNPGGLNKGNGWYFNYSGNHPYIINIVTLSPTVSATGPNAVRVVGSYKIQQNQEQPARDLHYRVGTDVDILSYRTWLDWPGTVAITETSALRELNVDWDLAQKPVPYGQWVTISTEFVEPNWNSITYNDVHFTYATGAGAAVPALAWTIETPQIENAEAIPHVTGGYVIGSFDVYDSAANGASVAAYRFVHQYRYDQTPEEHVFYLTGDPGYLIANLRFGHSYGYPTTDALWQFEDWLTATDATYDLGAERIFVPINWQGRLPYPEGVGMANPAP